MSKLWVLALVLSFGLAGCAVEFENTQAAREIAELDKPPGSVYAGWRVYQDKCVGCHGPEATGSASAPNLLLRVRDLGPQRFVSLVLQRYDWGLPAAQAKDQTPSYEALIEDIMRRKDAPITMPAWGDEPRVSAHILDLYAYLSARSEGTQGLGRPAP
jgi:mono/diheme cytochrome c family protein